VRHPTIFGLSGYSIRIDRVRIKPIDSGHNGAGAGKATFVTQHDHRNDIDRDTGNGPRPEDVTREQNGQFSMESDSVHSAFGEGPNAVETAELREGGAGSIHAMQVSMDRSGAEYINAQKAFLTNSGAKSIEGESSKLTQSGVLQLSTKKAELHHSSAVMVVADEVQVESGAVAVGVFRQGTIGDGSRVGFMVSGDVDADGDINTFFMIGGDVKAGGSVTSTMDTTAAAVFGAVFGAVFALVWKMIRRG